jgi:predicted histidine transporter YuiF (NhaC family)
MKLKAEHVIYALVISNILMVVGFLIFVYLWYKSKTGSP